jgi:hypothetical protein
MDTLLRLHLCVRATTTKPPRGIAKGVLPRGCSRVIPKQMAYGGGEVFHLDGGSEVDIL